ncbi:DUF2971 domain-containing protein [Hymenobacter cellulosivorans]|uniref:DUF2971 domain-containing protein n=1 Tax=Hymenobacter cellulosivorans TaxID=2932249 RepID=A0ABY4F301_9BACT|nr:DUF2971 domain-containing protein [Hymenobacter cellulosivorans]UOQ51036.1 DUF2971 domain-containing protein [Hymenobacter cellulosivorans]
METHTPKRLQQAAKDLNASMLVLVNFLASKGHIVESKPTTKLTAHQVSLLDDLDREINHLTFKKQKAQVPPSAITTPLNTPSNPSPTTIATIDKIREEKGIPKTIYKFYGTEKYHFESLRESYIYFAPPSKFNDPYDCSLDTITFSVKKQTNYRKNKEKEFKERYTTLGVCCFSRKNTSILMWSHYANCHKGFCLEYRIENKKSVIRPFDVNYTDHYVTMDFSREPKESIFNMILTKHRQWEYEEEVRYFTGGFRTNDERKYPLQRNVLEAVYLGINCEAETINTIRLILKEHYNSSIKVYQAKKCKGSFEIEFQQINL